MSETLKDRLTGAVKAAMKSADKPRVAALRLILAGIKQQEVDSRDAVDDDSAIALLTRMAKQRRESIQQFEAAGRQDLADKEVYELAIITEFLPAQLDEAEIEAAVSSAIAEADASSMRDMGKVMGLLKPALAGKADMAAVSAMVKARLTG